jgi:hypothetical protein
VPAVLAVSHFRLDAPRRPCSSPAARRAARLAASPWLGWLRSADEPAVAGLGARVLLDTPSLPRLVSGARPTPVVECAGDASATSTCRARCGSCCRTRCPADRWPAGTTASRCTTPARAPRCGAARTETARAGLAAGRLMPWGDGWALSLESLEG